MSRENKDNTLKADNNEPDQSLTVYTCTTFNYRMYHVTIASSFNLTRTIHLAHLNYLTNSDLASINPSNKGYLVNSIPIFEKKR